MWQTKLLVLTWVWLCAWFTGDFLACPLSSSSRKRVNFADRHLDLSSNFASLLTPWLLQTTELWVSGKVSHLSQGWGREYSPARCLAHSSSLSLTVFFTFFFHLLHRHCLQFPQDCFQIWHLLFWDLLGQWFSKCEVWASRNRMQILRSRLRST